MQYFNIRRSHLYVCAQSAWKSTQWQMCGLFQMLSWRMSHAPNVSLHFSKNRPFGLTVFIKMCHHLILLFFGPILCQVHLDHDLSLRHQVLLQFSKFSEDGSDSITMWSHNGHLPCKFCAEVSFRHLKIQKKGLHNHGAIVVNGTFCPVTILDGWVCWAIKSGLDVFHHWACRGCQLTWASVCGPGRVKQCYCESGANMFCGLSTGSP